MTSRVELMWGRRQERPATEAMQSLAAEVDRLTGKFEQLFDAPSAYRPGDRIPRREIVGPYAQAQLVHLLSSMADHVEMTPEDALVVAVSLIEAIDDHRDFLQALDVVATRAFKEHALRTMAGYPFTPGKYFGDLCWSIAFVVRPEAWREAVMENTAEGGPEVQESTDGYEILVRSLGGEFLFVSSGEKAFGTCDLIGHLATDDFPPMMLVARSGSLEIYDLEGSLFLDIEWYDAILQFRDDRAAVSIRLPFISVEYGVKALSVTDFDDYDTFKKLALGPHP